MFWAIPRASLTDKDRRDAEFLLGLGADFLALSFVRRAEDITALRKIYRNSGASTSVIAKIEKPEALENSSAILDAADGIMIARGDLGVELPAEQVPIAQTQLIDRARAAVELGIASRGESILLVRGFHADPQVNTPSVRVLTITRTDSSSDKPARAHRPPTDRV
jgi:hypothetical protein